MGGLPLRSLALCSHCELCYADPSISHMHRTPCFAPLDPRLKGEWVGSATFQSSASAVDGSATIPDSASAVEQAICSTLFIYILYFIFETSQARSGTYIDVMPYAVHSWQQVGAEGGGQPATGAGVPHRRQQAAGFRAAPACAAASAAQGPPAARHLFGCPLQTPGCASQGAGPVLRICNRNCVQHIFTDESLTELH